jgi:hypothetical protein
MRLLELWLQRIYCFREGVEGATDRGASGRRRGALAIARRQSQQKQQLNGRAIEGRRHC